MSKLRNIISALSSVEVEMLSDVIPMLGVSQYKNCFKVECNLLQGNLIHGTTLGMGNEKIVDETIKVASRYVDDYKVDPPVITSINCENLCTKCNTVYTHWWKLDKIDIESKL